MKTIERVGVILCETKQVVPKVNICYAKLVTEFLQTGIRLLELFNDTVIYAWQNALYVDFGCR